MSATDATTNAASTKANTTKAMHATTVTNDANKKKANITKAMNAATVTKAKAPSIKAKKKTAAKATKATAAKTTKATAAKTTKATKAKTAKAPIMVWHEVADTHPAASTHIIYKCNEADHVSAASATLGVPVTLVPLSIAAHDKFVTAGGWSVWRVESQSDFNGRWIYTRQVEGAYVSWRPTTWKECVERYEQHIQKSLASNAGWKKRMQRDCAVVDAMVNALGTTDPMNPFEELATAYDLTKTTDAKTTTNAKSTKTTNTKTTNANKTMEESIFKAAVQDVINIYKSDGPGSRAYPRGLAMIHDPVGFQRCVGDLVELAFSKRADAWIEASANAGASLTETDEIEWQLMEIMDDGAFVTLASCMAIGVLCKIDPEAAQMWYETGGDCAGHPKLETYCAEARTSFTNKLHAMASLASADSRLASAAYLSDLDKDDPAGKLLRCGAPTVSGAICMHKVSAASKTCPAGHIQRHRAL